MSATDESWKGYERLVDALSADLLAADAGEIEGSQTGHGARVQADSLRQALRRAAASAPPDDGLPSDVVRTLVMRPEREDKP